MARDENPLFSRGRTFYDGNTIDTANYDGIPLEGKEYVFEDVDPRAAATSPGSSPGQRTGRYVRCRIVRNVSGVTLLPKRVVSGQKTAGMFTKRIDGYTTLTAGDRLGVIDEYLPAAGVKNGDLFWLVVEGPALCLTDIAGGAANVINVGDRVVALTAATSQATTAGRVASQDITGATSVLGGQIENMIGRALSARTTANTNTDILVDVGVW